MTENGFYVSYALKICRAIILSGILVGACVVASLAQATASAADSPLNAPGLTQRAAEIVAALKEYRASLEVLLPLRERELTGAIKLREQRREFYSRGIIEKRELEETEAAVARAEEKIEETRRAIAAADHALAEATTTRDSRQGQREPVPPAPPQPSLRLPSWSPLARITALPSVGTPKDPTVLFELLSRSVWLVVASESLIDTKQAGKQARNVAVGSAVAMTQKTLLTNCHIVENRPFVWIKQANLIERVRITASEAKTDRCILSTEREILSPVKQIRTYDGLKVGEQVFTIGSPSGLESTLAQGIISGLRRIGRQRLVQTTAPISPGSSGGGLFDQSGNLIGITTFTLRDSQGLNFAIAAEDYFH